MASKQPIEPRCPVCKADDLSAPWHPSDYGLFSLICLKCGWHTKAAAAGKPAAAKAVNPLAEMFR